MTESQLRVLDEALDKLFAPTAASRWVAEQAPVVAQWKAGEEADFKRYCEQRDMGIRQESLSSCFEDEKFEPMYRVLRRVA